MTPRAPGIAAGPPPPPSLSPATSANTRVTLTSHAVGRHDTFTVAFSVASYHLEILRQGRSTAPLPSPLTQTRARTHKHPSDTLWSDASRGSDDDDNDHDSLASTPSVPSPTSSHGEPVAMPPLASLPPLRIAQGGATASQSMSHSMSRSMPLGGGGGGGVGPNGVPYTPAFSEDLGPVSLAPTPMHFGGTPAATLRGSHQDQGGGGAGHTGHPQGHSHPVLAAASSFEWALHPELVRELDECRSEVEAAGRRNAELEAQNTSIRKVTDTPGKHPGYTRDTRSPCAHAHPLTHRHADADALGDGVCVQVVSDMREAMEALQVGARPHAHGHAHAHAHANAHAHAHANANVHAHALIYPLLPRRATVSSRNLRRPWNCSTKAGSSATRPT